MYGIRVDNLGELGWVSNPQSEIATFTTRVLAMKVAIHAQNAETRQVKRKNVDEWGNVKLFWIEHLAVKTKAQRYREQ